MPPGAGRRSTHIKAKEKREGVGGGCFGSFCQDESCRAVIGNSESVQSELKQLACLIQMAVEICGEKEGAAVAAMVLINKRHVVENRVKTAEQAEQADLKLHIQKPQKP